MIGSIVLSLVWTVTSPLFLLPQLFVFALLVPIRIFNRIMFVFGLSFDHHLFIELIILIYQYTIVAFVIGCIIGLINLVIFCTVGYFSKWLESHVKIDLGYLFNSMFTKSKQEDDVKLDAKIQKPVFSGSDKDKIKKILADSLRAKYHKKKDDKETNAPILEVKKDAEKSQQLDQEANINTIRDEHEDKSEISEPINSSEFPETLPNTDSISTSQSEKYNSIGQHRERISHLSSRSESNSDKDVSLDTSNTSSSTLGDIKKS